MQPKPVLLLSMADDRSGRQLSSMLNDGQRDVVHVQVPEVATAALSTVRAHAYIVDEALGRDYCHEQLQRARELQGQLPVVLIQRQHDAEQECRYLQAGARYVLRDDDMLMERLLIILQQFQQEQCKQATPSAEFSQDVLDALPDAAIIIDEQYCVQALNPVARSWSLNVGQQLIRPIHPHSAEGNDDLIQWRRTLDVALAKIKTEQRVFEQTLVFQGQRMHYSWMPMPKDACLLLVKYIGSVQEHSQEAINNHMQAHKLESLRTFAAGMAHEFNNAFGIISASLGLMKNKCQDMDHIYGPIDQAVERGHRLTNSILTFAQQQETSFDNIDLVQVVQNSFNVLKNTMSDDINMVLDINVESAQLRGNAAHIHQVLLHLVSNASYAIQHHLDDGQRGALQIGLHVDTEADKHAVRLWVQDNGCGIDPVRLDRVCDPFYTSKPSGEGTGMGLSVVNGIVKKHQGQMEIYSNLNQGTCVEIRLPVHSSQVETVYQERSCLLVDDDEMVLEMTSRCLEAMGCRCQCASDMDEAIKILDLGIYNFDVVVTDWNMPRGNGTALAQQIRQRFPALPIILVSGYINPEAREELLDMVDAILDKPCSAKQIINCMNYLVQDAAGQECIDESTRSQTQI